MRAVLPWIAAYLAILVVWALIILRRTGPTLWKGRSLVVLNIAFVLVSTIVVLWRGETLSVGFVVLDFVLIILALAVREKWLLLRISHADSGAVLERCLTQTRASSTRRADGYAVQCGATEMTVLIQPTRTRLVSVRFSGATSSKKAALIRALFGKQFHNSFPTPRLRA